MPSSRSEPKASASAWPQSIPPAAIASRRRSSCRISFGLEGEIGRQGEKLFVERLEPGGGYGRDDGVGRAQGGHVVARRHELRRGRERGLEVLVRRPQLGQHAVDQRSSLLRCDDTLGGEPGGVLLAHGRLAVDPLDQQRLGIRRLVLLLMAVPAVADQVDHEVLAELAPVRSGEPDRAQRSFGVVGVHVDDRDVEALGQVARVPGRATLFRVGREADLVVGDQVQRPARRIALEAVHVQCLRNDTLRWERRVTVDQHGQRDRRVVKTRSGRAVGLLRARPAFDDRVDGLEVARVRNDRDLDLTRSRHARPRRRQVVLHVARPALGIGDDGVDRPLALELAQDRFVRAADRVRERVQPPAVRHADHDLECAVLRRLLDREVEHRDEHVEAFERKLLLPDERPPQVLLQPLDLRQPP